MYKTGDRIKQSSYTYNIRQDSAPGEMNAFCGINLFVDPFACEGGRIFFLKIWLFENKYVTLHHRCNNRNLHLRSVPTFWVRISSFIDRSSTNIPQKVKEMM